MLDFGGLYGQTLSGEHYAFLVGLTFMAANRAVACLEISSGAAGRKNQVMLPIVSEFIGNTADYLDESFFWRVSHGI